MLVLETLPESSPPAAPPAVPPPVPVPVPPPAPVPVPAPPSPNPPLLVRLFLERNDCVESSLNVEFEFEPLQAELSDPRLEIDESWETSLDCLGAMTLGYDAVGGRNNPLISVWSGSSSMSFKSSSMDKTGRESVSHPGGFMGRRYNGVEFDSVP